MRLDQRYLGPYPNIDAHAAAAARWEAALVDGKPPWCLKLSLTLSNLDKRANGANNPEICATSWNLELIGGLGGLSSL